MEVFKTIKQLQLKILSFKSNKTIAFVPTMGALHKGHLSLIKKAKKENDIIVVSIFVNPTQFDNPDDLIKYPNTLEADLKLLIKIKCDFVFTPNVQEIYSNTIKPDHFDFGGIENEMEGKFRAGHFDGVATIVKKLFNIVKPNTAYFGEKDYQQLQIIKKLVEIENLPIKIVGCKIFREKDGLAMSSRNVRLTKKHRNHAPFIYKTLKKAKKKYVKKSAKEVEKWLNKKFEKQANLKLEYFIIADQKSLKRNEKKEHKQRAFIAVFAGKIRLIDNIALY